MSSLRLLRPPCAATARRLLCTGGAGGRPTVLAALVERIPVVMPEISEDERSQRLAKEELILSRAKVWPEAFTASEEGPERTRARQRLESIVEGEGGREGEGDRAGDESSLDRRLAQRLYLLLQGEDGSWAFPERAWQPPEPARDGLRELIAESCGDALDAHQVGNAPVAHLERDADSVFFWRFQYVQGEMNPQEGTQHAWLTKDELSERLGGPLGELATKMCGPMS